MSLRSAIGQKTGPVTQEVVRKSVNRMLAEMNAVIMGGSVTDVQLLWNKFSLKEKLQWFWMNKLTSKAAKIRAEIDAENERRYNAALEELEDEDDEADYERIKYPYLAESSPKSMFVIDLKIRPIQPLEFISLNVQLDQLDRK